MTTVILFDDNDAIVASFGSIQAAIDAASDGYRILASAGVYNESLTITKGVTIEGEDLNADGVPDVIISPAGANGISISGDIDNGGSATVAIIGIEVDGAANSGVNIASNTNLSSLVVTNSSFANNGIFGIGAGSGMFDVDSVSITNTTFTDNGFGGANGAGDIVLFGFVGDATIADVSITSSATELTAVASRGDNAIQITGRDPVTYDVLGPIGNVVLNNVSVDGWYHKPQLLIQGYTDFNGLTLSGVDLSGGTSWGDLLFVDPIGTSGDGAPSTPGAPGYFPLTGGASTLDLSGVTINSGSTGVLGFDSRIRGTDADDSITGTNGNDLLNDYAETGIDYGGDDVVSGLGGDDALIGGVGNDTLHGGADNDTAIFIGNSSEYDLAYTSDANGFVIAFDNVTDSNAGDGDEGTDTLISLENLLFIGDGAILSTADPVQLFDQADQLVGTFATIQEAVDAAATDYTIRVSAGTYREQVVVNGVDGLSIIGVGGTVILEAPDTLVQTSTSTSGRSTFAIFTVEDADDVVLTGVNIDGRGVTAGLGGTNPSNVGVLYRNASGGLEDVDVTGVRDPYPGGTAAGGEPIVSGVQRGVGVQVDNDAGPVLPFFMHGGVISDFQKNATVFGYADLDISGVEVIGGGAQTIIAQNGFQAFNSTGSIDGNTLTGIGYAGGALAYSGAVLAYGNTDLNIVNNIITGSNIDDLAAKVVGIFILDFGAPNSGGQVSGNTISHVDTGIGVYGDIQPNAITVTGNTISNIDAADPYAAALDYEPDSGLATVFNTTGTNLIDILSGSDGNDTLVGLGGDDTLDGQVGDDTLEGNGGRDLMYGGDGADSLHGFGSHDSLYGGNGDDDLRGGFGKDLLNGSGGNDILRGFEGDDRLFGGGNSDTLLGNDGNDSLIGGGGTDRLKGDNGDDTLNGSFGTDVLTGGAGDDLFEYRQGHGADFITDFTAGAASEDAINLIAFGAAFDSFAEVMAVSIQVGTGVVIDFGGGDIVTLQNVFLADLHADDFVFG